MTLDESKDTKDNLMDIEKIKILVGHDVVDLMGDSTPLTIDFQNNFFGKGFTINTGFNC
jgi:Fe-S cluster assembly iron-binding protein IscA